MSHRVDVWLDRVAGVAALVYVTAVVVGIITPQSVPGATRPALPESAGCDPLCPCGCGRQACQCHIGSPR